MLQTKRHYQFLQFCKGSPSAVDPRLAEREETDFADIDMDADLDEDAGADLQAAA